MFLTATLTEEEEQRTEPEQESDDGEEGCSEDDRPSKEEFQLLQAEKADLEQKLAEREAELQRPTERYAQLWRLNCDQLREFDHLIEEKGAHVRELTGRVQQLEAPSRTTPVSALPKAATPRALESTTHAQPNSPVLSDSMVWSTPVAKPLGTSSDTRNRKGKAPPVDPFTGDPKGELNFDDWLPTLERTSATSISVTMRR